MVCCILIFTAIREFHYYLPKMNNDYKNETCNITFAYFSFPKNSQVTLWSRIFKGADTVKVF